MATGSVTSSWAASFCLGCDNQAYGSDYCSERCHLQDKEHSSRMNRSDNCPRRHDERRHSLPRSALGVRLFLTAGDPQPSLVRRRYSEDVCAINSSKSMTFYPRCGSFETSRPEVLTPSTNQDYNGCVREKDDETATNYTSSGAQVPERRRVVHAPRTDNVVTLTDWDIWRPRQASLAIATEEITMRLQVENSSDDM